MVRLVFLPQMCSRLSSTCHLPGLVEHTKLSQRVEAGWAHQGLGDGSRERVVTGGAAWLARTALAARPGPTGAEAPWRGRCHQHPGEGVPQALGATHHSGQKPMGTRQPGCMPESWVVASLSPGGSVSHPRSGSLGPSAKGLPEGTY